MPVWSILTALALLTAFAVKLAVLGSDERLREADAAASPALRRLADIVGLHVIALCLVNAVSVVVQCGVGQCHTMGYKMLQ